jgi:hypothetical protein
MLKNVVSIGYLSELTDLNTQKVAFSCVRGRKHCATPKEGVIADVVRKALRCCV